MIFSKKSFQTSSLPTSSNQKPQILKKSKNNFTSIISSILKTSSSSLSFPNPQSNPSRNLLIGCKFKNFKLRFIIRRLILISLISISLSIILILSSSSSSSSSSSRSKNQSSNRILKFLKLDNEEEDWIPRINLKLKKIKRSSKSKTLTTKEEEEEEEEEEDYHYHYYYDESKDFLDKKNFTIQVEPIYSDSKLHTSSDHRKLTNKRRSNSLSNLKIFDLIFRILKTNNNNNKKDLKFNNSKNDDDDDERFKRFSGEVTELIWPPIVKEDEKKIIITNESSSSSSLDHFKSFNDFELLPSIELFSPFVKLKDNDPKPIDLAFGLATTTERAESLSLVWSNWLGKGSSRTDDEEGKDYESEKKEEDRPMCVIVLGDEEFEREGANDNDNDEDYESKASKLLKTFKSTTTKTTKSDDRWSDKRKRRGLEHCHLKKSSLGESKEIRYQLRYFGLIRDIEEISNSERRKRPDWFVISDDDTVWIDQRMLRKQLGRFDPDEPRLIGASSEGLNQLDQFGMMAYGGAGMIISRGLVKKILIIHDQCFRELRDVFGGDEMYSICAAKAMGNGKTKESVVTQLVSLHQMDIPGDGTGFFQSGLPFLSLHHLWHSWTIPFGREEHETEFNEPDRSLNQLLLLQKSSSILGPRNFLKRFIFESGKDLITIGYSITRFSEPIEREDFKKIEKTWKDSNYELRFSTRSKVEEVNTEEDFQDRFFKNERSKNYDDEIGRRKKKFKRTFYLTEIREIDEDEEEKIEGGGKFNKNDQHKEDDNDKEEEEDDDDDESFLKLKKYSFIHLDKFGERVELRFK